MHHEMREGLRAAVLACRAQQRRWVSLRRMPRKHLQPRKVRPRMQRRRSYELDEVVVMHKKYRAPLLIKDLLESSKGHVINVHALGKLKHVMNFETGKRLSTYAYDYPGLLKVTVDRDGWRWMELTDEAEELVAEKDKYMKEVHEGICVRNLRKLLMMIRNHRLTLRRLDGFKELLGLPHDYKGSLLKSYPNYFRVVTRKDKDTLELLEWDDKLAVTTREQRLKDNALELDELMGDTNPHAFPMRFPRGAQLTRRGREFYENWQKIPFLSPYDHSPHLGSGLESQKRKVAAIHELLSLCVEKYARVNYLYLLRRKLWLGHEIESLIERYPGIFYASYKENEFTVFLKEAYNGMRLIDRSPLLDIRDKFVLLCRMGPGSMLNQPIRPSHVFAKPIDVRQLKNDVKFSGKRRTDEEDEGRKPSYIERRKIVRNGRILQGIDGRSRVANQQKVVRDLVELEESVDGMGKL